MPKLVAIHTLAHTDTHTHTHKYTPHKHSPQTHT